MSETTIPKRDSGGTWARPTGERHRFIIQNFQGHILEVEDAHFHHDSAVMMPDYGECDPNVDEQERITGLAVLLAGYRHAQDHPAQKILLAGHTDTSGPDSYNLTLSQMRADNVLHLLLGNRDDWAQIAENKHKIEDYQQILKWIATTHGWDCDPGTVDNQLGPNTRRGIKGFQERYNEEFSASIAESGVVNLETWKAFFDLYMLTLKDELNTDDAGLAGLRGELTFLDSGKKTVGCGENFPIEAPRQQNYRSRTNRRVEVLFFDPGEEPLLQCHAGAGKCTPGSCEIYDLKRYRFDRIPCLPLPVAVKLRFVDNTNTEITSAGSLQVSNFVTNQQLPTANSFTGTSTDPENFRIEAESATHSQAHLELQRGGARVLGPLNLTLVRGTGADSRKFRSFFLRLISDSSDDAASGNGVAADPNNQTVLVALGDRIKIEYEGRERTLVVGRPTSENNNGANTQLHDIRVLKVNIVVFRRPTVAAPARTRAQIQADINTANERFAQSCIRLAPTINMGGAGDPGVPLPAALTNGFTRQGGTINAFNADELAVIALGDADPNSIDAFYVDTITNTSRATSYRASRINVPGSTAKNFIIMSRGAGVLSFPHELMHILLDSPHRANEPATSLIRGGTSATKAVNGTKRIGPYPQAAAVGVGNNDTQTIRNRAERLP